MTKTSMTSTARVARIGTEPDQVELDSLAASGDPGAQSLAEVHAPTSVVRPLNPHLSPRRIRRRTTTQKDTTAPGEFISRGFKALSWESAKTSYQADPEAFLVRCEDLARSALPSQKPSMRSVADSLNIKMNKAAQGRTKISHDHLVCDLATMVNALTAEWPLARPQVAGRALKPISELAFVPGVTGSETIELARSGLMVINVGGAEGGSYVSGASAVAYLERQFKRPALTADQKKKVMTLAKAQAKELRGRDRAVNLEPVVKQVVKQSGLPLTEVRAVLLGQALFAKPRIKFDDVQLAPERDRRASRLDLFKGKDLEDPQERRALARMLKGFQVEEVPHPIFESKRAVALVEQLPEPEGVPSKAPRIDFTDLRLVQAGDKADPLPYTAEQHLFRAYNLRRNQVAGLIRELSVTNPTRADLESVYERLRESENLRSTLIEANLSLVPAMARRHAKGPFDMGAVHGEGVDALFRCVDGFDFSKGLKFSTYCCRAIVTAMKRETAKQADRWSSTKNGLGEVLDLVTSAPADRSSELTEQEVRRRRMVRELLEELGPTERMILVERYMHAPGTKPKTLEQLAKVVGVTKERIRQIQNSALKKLRGMMYPSDEEELLA